MTESDITRQTAPWTPPDRPTIAVWLGCAAPARSIRWLDGALAAAAKLGAATAIAAGEPAWLDLANDRALRAGLPSAAGIATDLQLDYLGWAQVAAAAVRALGATMVLVDEASRPERAAEVAAIAELLDAAQITRVVSLASDGKPSAVVHASRVAGATLQTLHLRAPIVIGVRIAGAAVDDYPTPAPSISMRRLDLPALGLDPNVLAHRALPPRTSAAPRGTIERVADQLAVHLAPREAT